MTTLGRGFVALRHPNYRLFWTGQFISLAGTWMQTVAQSWLVLQLTGSAVDLGIVNALQMLPVLLVGPFGGVFADRFPKRRVLVITQIFQMVLAFVLGALVTLGWVQIWHVYLLAALLGLTNAFDMPTRQAFTMEMVGREDLMNGVALNSMQFNAARVVGPALAGLTIAAVGVAGSFYANGVSFIFVIAGLLMMRSERFFAVSPGPQESVLRSLSGGARYVWHSPRLLLLTVLVGVLGCFAFNTNVLIPLFVTNILHSGPERLGLLLSAMGIGSLISAMLAAYQRQPRWRVLFAGALALCTAELLLAVSTTFIVAFVFMLLMGFSMMLFFTSANTAVNQSAPDHLRGRVMGVYMSVNMGSMPFGNLASGAIAAAFGVPLAIGGGAGVALFVMAIAGFWVWQHRGRADLTIAPALVEEDPEMPAAPPSAERARAPREAVGARS